MCSKATEHKFLIQYRLPPLSTAREPSSRLDREGTNTGDTVGEEEGRAIQDVVLELGKLIQTALWIHGLYGHPEMTDFLRVAGQVDDDDYHHRDVEDGYQNGLGDVGSGSGAGVRGERRWRGVEEVQDGLLCDSTMLALDIWKTGINQILEGTTTSFSSSSPLTTTALRRSGSGSHGEQGGPMREWEQAWGLEEGEWVDLYVDPVRRRVRVDAITVSCERAMRWTSTAEVAK